MLIFTLSLQGYDLCKVEQALVDVLAFLHPLIALGGATTAQPSVIVRCIPGCGAKWTRVPYCCAYRYACFGPTSSTFVDAGSLRPSQVDEIENSLRADR